MRFVVPDLADPMLYPKSVRRAVAQRQQAVRQAFRDHNARIRPLLPPSLQRLQETDLNDGLIRALRIDAKQRTLQLCLRCGDLQQGYFDLDLEYKDVQLTHQETSLFCFITHEEAEVDRDEIDVEDSAGSPVFIHRISWHTGIQTDREPAEGVPAYLYMLKPETELRFGGLEIKLALRPNRQFLRANDFITIVRDPDRIEGMEP